jgi:hypothetical protein
MLEKKACEAFIGVGSGHKIESTAVRSCRLVWTKKNPQLIWSVNFVFA